MTWYCIQQGRRAIAVRVIDAKLGGAKEGYFHEKKISLLAKEDKIEDEFEKQVIFYRDTTSIMKMKCCV